jgi:hypothetical protein
VLKFVHKKLPEGSFRPKWRSELYELLPRKKRMYPENRKLRVGYRYLLYSKYAKVFYERVIDEHTLDENLHYYLTYGILFLWPTEETIGQIREEMEQAQLSYRELMWRRQAEWNYFERNNSRPTGNGDQFWKKFYKDEYQKYLKSKS